MCKLPTNTSPIVIRLPRLRFFEGVAAGLRADVKETASARGHRMSSFTAGDSHCLDCRMEVSVYAVHYFQDTEKGLVYRGTALDNECPGKPSPDGIIRRVTPRNRPLKVRTS